MDQIPDYETHLFRDDGTFPNNTKLMLVFYKQVFRPEPTVDPQTIENVFDNHHWVNSWRNGLYTMHHYHSTAHEVLGIYSGWVEAQLGGPMGKIVTAKAGDVIIIPAGVSHKNIGQSSDFRVVGAYPRGQSWDMNFGKAGERPQADKHIQQVRLPQKDPVFGERGLLLQIWDSAGNGNPDL